MARLVEAAAPTVKPRPRRTAAVSVPPDRRTNADSCPRQLPADSILRAEWRWLAVVVAAVLMLVEIPYALAYAQASRGHVFVGMFWSPHDFAQYGAAMREGAAGASWLIHDHLTAEPHSPALMYPLYVALGKLAGALGGHFQAVYHLAEIAARAALLVSIYAFSAAVLPSVGQRRPAFVLVAFSSGLAALLTLGFGILGLKVPVPAQEFNEPEMNTFLALFTAPHLMLGLALLLFAARLYASSRSARSLRPLLALAVVVALLGLVNPFSLATLCAVVAVHTIVIWGRNRQVPDGALLGVGTVFLAAGPFLLGNWLVFAADPFWGVVYGRQNVTPSPPPLNLVLGLGGVLPLALLALPTFMRDPRPARSLVAVWILLSLVLMYLPVGFQRRFAFGLHPMLAVMAVVGLRPVWGWVRRERPGVSGLGRPLLTFGLGQALFGSTLFLYLFVVLGANDPLAQARAHAAAARPAEPGDRTAFQPVSLQRAAHWVATAMGPEDVLLAQTLTGNYFAGHVPGRVYVGHAIGTLDFREKEQAARRFYRSDADADRLRFLRSNHVRYVVYGPYERAWGVAAPPEHPSVRPVYANAEVTVYEVELDPSVGSPSSGHDGERPVPSPSAAVVIDDSRGHPAR